MSFLSFCGLFCKSVFFSFEKLRTKTMEMEFFAEGQLSAKDGDGNPKRTQNLF